MVLNSEKKGQFRVATGWIEKPMDIPANKGKKPFPIVQKGGIKTKLKDALIEAHEVEGWVEDANAPAHVSTSEYPIKKK